MLTADERSVFLGDSRTCELRGSACKCTDPPLPTPGAWILSMIIQEGAGNQEGKQRRKKWRKQANQVGKLAGSPGPGRWQSEGLAPSLEEAHPATGVSRSAQGSMGSRAS